MCRNTNISNKSGYTSNLWHRTIISSYVSYIIYLITVVLRYYISILAILANYCTKFINYCDILVNSSSHYLPAPKMSCNLCISSPGLHTIYWVSSAEICWVPSPRRRGSAFPVNKTNLSCCLKICMNRRLCLLMHIHGYVLYMSQNNVLLVRSQCSIALFDFIPNTTGNRSMSLEN